MDIESVNVIEPYGRFFFFDFLFSSQTSSQYTNVQDGTALLMNTRVNKNNKKKTTFDLNQTDSHIFVYLSIETC